MDTALSRPRPRRTERRPQGGGCFRKAIHLHRGLGSRRGQAVVLADLGDTLAAAGHPGLASSAWQAAHDVHTRSH